MNGNKIKSIHIFLLLCITAFIVSSCNKDNPVDTSQTNKQFWPLKLGNTWSYRAISYDSLEVVTGTGSMDISVTRDTIVNGETWYQLSNDGTVFYANKSDGFWAMWNSSSTLVQQLIYKYPASVGNNWNYYSNDISVQSTDTSISVQQGTHSCYAYRWLYDTNLVRVDYCSRGVGLVAADYYTSTSSGLVYRNMAINLMSFSLK